LISTTIGDTVIFLMTKSMTGRDLALVVAAAGSCAEVWQDVKTGKRVIKHRTEYIATQVLYGNFTPGAKSS